MATNYYRPPNFGRLQSHLDPTAIAFDTIFNYSISISLAKLATYRSPDTTTFPTDATYTVTSSTTTSDNYDSSTLYHNFSKATFLHTSTFNVADPERLSGPHMRDPSHAQLETRR